MEKQISLLNKISREVSLYTNFARFGKKKNTEIFCMKNNEKY